MATIGQALTAPESGWKRINADHSLLSYKGSWITQTNSAYSGGINKYTSTPGDSISFTFRGTKLRYIGQYNTTSKIPLSISIDGVTEQISFLSNTLINSVLVYEKTGLVEDTHTVVLTFNATNEYQSIQGIDIDSTGSMLHPDEVTDIKDLAIGKRIRCNYSALSGYTGTFSGLGEESADFIPISSSANPSGDFYFIMVEDFNKKKILIADRNIQSSISWDTLNSSGIVSGVKMPTKPFKGTLSGYENDEVQVSDNGYISGANGDYFGWKALDGKNGNGDKWANSISASKPAELTVRFKKRKPIINAFTITPPPSASANSVDHPKHFKLQASDDGSSWVDLFEYTAGIGASRTRFTFNNQQAYSYYRFTVLSTNGGSQVQIGEIEFESENKLSNIETNIRLLTGGTKSGDKDNEWDNYIVNSTLNGKIIAGDNAVWNWGVFSWSSTSTAATYRSRRGQNTSSGFSESPTTTVNFGFRPILEIKANFRIRSLILSNGEYKKLNDSYTVTERTATPISIKMTSDNTPSPFVASASSALPNYPAYLAFDGVNATVTDSWICQSNSGWLKIDMGTQIVVGNYEIEKGHRFADDAPKEWTFEGSNNDTDWTILDAQTNQVNWTNGEKRSYMIANPMSFRYYRVNVVISENSAYLTIGALNLLEYGTVTKTVNAFSLETVSTTLPALDTFINTGIDDISILNRKLTTITIPMNDNTASGVSLGKGKMFKERIDLNKYIDIKKINAK
ncbi:F5/8 type C domain-containing protein [Paenibacillus sp. cl141a]|uniref:discoidin domain-containing protein n=1 Tax=Paenibacillus sp. cl141a TaxID=1761877 RepID=UPI0008D28DBD|nr:discoidin domain-containing protein [Paenibacillus sp. cl141a]SEL81232.1 F5/8 type C domain-containing protein [Paenibacillus sp. cl141a]